MEGLEAAPAVLLFAAGRAVLAALAVPAWAAAVLVLLSGVEALLVVLLSAAEAVRRVQWCAQEA